MKLRHDSEFTKLLANHMLNAKGFFDYGVRRGLTSPESLRLSVTARQETAKRLMKKGVSVRKIAKAIGASKSQIHRDLGVPKRDKSVPKRDSNGDKVRPAPGTILATDRISDVIVMAERSENKQFTAVVNGWRIKIEKE